MNSHNSLSMNSSRPYEAFVEKQQNLNKENNCNYIEKEKEEKFKELIDKNERLEKECLKFQIQVKNLEDKLQTFKEKEYKSQNNTSSNFLLPSEFRKIWEDFGKESIGDIFVDFFDDFMLSLHLFQEIMLITHSHFKEELKNITTKVMKFMEIKNISKSYSFIEKNIKPIILEYYDDIFENESKSDSFYQRIRDEYARFVNDKFLGLENCTNKNVRELIKADKTNELRELIENSYIKDFLRIVKKIFLFVEFHEPQLNLKLDSFVQRKPNFKTLKQGECILVDGYIKEVKNCLILLEPPLLKNGYPYSGLKPIALICPDNINVDLNTDKKNDNTETLLVSASNTNKNENCKSLNTNAINIPEIEESNNNINKNSQNNNITNDTSNNQNKNIINKENKEITIPFKKDERLNSSIKTKFSEIEKKEKIYQFILDNDREKDIDASLGKLDLNRNSKNDHKIDSYSKNLDIAFSKNPNTSSSKDFSNSNSKVNFHLPNSHSEKPGENENSFLNEIKKNLLEYDKPSKDFMKNHHEEKLIIEPQKEKNNNLENNNADAFSSSIIDLNGNYIQNSNLLVNCNILKNKIKANNLINISNNSVNDSKIGNSNIDNNSFNKNKNTSSYSIISNHNNNSQINESSLPNSNNKNINKTNIIKISKGLNPENNFKNNRININLSKIESKESSPFVKISENSQSVKNLSIHNPIIRSTKNDLNSKDKSINFDNPTKTLNFDTTDKNLANIINSSKEKQKNLKEGFIKGINIINITNKLKDKNDINNSQNKIRKNSNESNRNTSNDKAIRISDLSRVSNQNQSEKVGPFIIANNNNSNPNLILFGNGNSFNNSNQNVQELNINFNKQDENKTCSKTSPVNRTSILSTKTTNPVNNFENEKKQQINNIKSNNLSNESKKIMQSFNNNTTSKHNIKESNTKKSADNVNNVFSNIQHHKILKKKPHEVQLTLTNQNFNFISNENNININPNNNYSHVNKNSTNKKRKNSSQEKDTKPEACNLSDFKKSYDKVYKISKNIRMSDLSHNSNNQNENQNEHSKKSFANLSNKSYASNSNSVISKLNFSKTRSTSEHQFTNKLNELNTHSYSYSHININRLNILSSKKSASNSQSIHESSRITKNRKSEGSNIFINNFKNFNNNFKEKINLAKKNSEKNFNNNLIENNPESIQNLNKNFCGNLNKNNKDSYKNRYAYLKSNNNNSKSKYNFISNSDKAISNLFNNQSSTGKLSNIINVSGKNDRYNSNYYSNSSNIYLHQTKYYASRQNSNDFTSNNYLSYNLNKTNSKTNFLNSSKEKDTFSKHTDDVKEKTNGTAAAGSIRSYTNEYKNNILKKEKNLINSKEKILNIHKIVKIPHNANAYKNPNEISSSRTHTNFETGNLMKFANSPPIANHKTTNMNSSLNAEREIIFNDENPHLETEGDELDFNQHSHKLFFSNSFTFNKDKSKSKLYEQLKSNSEKKMITEIFNNQIEKDKYLQSKERISKTQHNTINNENKSTITDHSNLKTKRDNTNKQFKNINSNLSKNKFMKPNILNLGNNVFIYSKISSHNNHSNLKSKINISNKNLIDLNNSKNTLYNENYLNTNTSENQQGIINSNYITKNNNPSNNPKKLSAGNSNGSKKKFVVEKKLHNFSNQQINNYINSNLNTTKEKILESNANTHNQNPVNIPLPSQTPNHIYNKSLNNNLNPISNNRNNEKVANKISQILSMQNKKTTSIRRNSSRTPNNNNIIKNSVNKSKGFSPKLKGYINLNIDNDSITNSIMSNTQFHIDLNNKNYRNTAVSKDCNEENDYLTGNVLITQNSTDSADKSITNHNLLKNEENEVINNLKKNLNIHSTINNSNYIDSNAQKLNNFNKLINTNSNINKNQNLNNIYTTIKKLSSNDTEENINRTLNSVNNSKSKDKNKRYNTNIIKYQNINKNKIKETYKDKDKVTKYPTLKEKKNEYMLLKDEFSYYDNNNSIQATGNEKSNKILNFHSAYNSNITNQNDINHNNHNYIHTTDDEEINEYNNNASKIINHEFNFLNDNFNDHSAEFTNEDLKILRYNLPSKKSEIESKCDVKRIQNPYIIQSENQEFNSVNLQIDEKAWIDLDKTNNQEIDYEDNYLDTNNSINTLNLNHKEIQKASNKGKINLKNVTNDISPMQKETIETCGEVYFTNDAYQNAKISEYDLNSNYKSSNFENFALIDQVMNNQYKKTKKSNSRTIYNTNTNANNNNKNDKTDTSGNSQNLNTEVSGKYANKTIDKANKKSTLINTNFYQGVNHNNKEKNISKNSNHIKNSNSKEIFGLTSGKKISPLVERKVIEPNANNKPTNLNMKFNYIDLASKNNKKLNTAQFINTNAASKEKANDKLKHNFININYIK